jgi:CRISPR-associated protein Csx10
MTRYPITATLLSPLAIKRSRQSQRSGGLDWLPGTTLRGALAGAYLQAHGAADAGFRLLFLDEAGCRFGPLDPARQVYPLTAASCKRKAGFLGDPKGRAHGMADTLWRRVAQGLASRPGRLPLWKCRRCGEDLKPQDGFYGPTPGGGRYDPETARDQVVAAHVGIDRASTTAAESIFYTIEALEPSAEAMKPSADEAMEPSADPARVEPDLIGWIDATPESHAALRQLLADEDDVIRLGHARTRGYGRVRIALGDGPVAETTDRAARERWGAELLESLRRPELAIAGLDPDRQLAFGLTLPTGAVLVDDLLRASIDPAVVVDWLPRLPLVDGPRGLDGRLAVAVEGGAICGLGAVARHDRLRGWNAAHGLPRQDEWAVARGSTYVYLFEGDDSGRVALHERLDRLARDGLGLRRNEGFGDAVVSDEFHRLYHQQEGTP